MEVEGVDVVFIGPNDLAATLNIPLGMNNRHPKHVEAVNKVREAGKRHNIPTAEYKRFTNLHDDKYITTKPSRNVEEQLEYKY